MSDTVQIRDERPEDYENVYHLVASAFEREDEAVLVKKLRATVKPFLSLVAEVDGKIVGHVFFSPVTIESSGAAAPPVGGLAPLSVDLAHRETGIGAELARVGLKCCPALGWKAVFVLGDPAYYDRFGFVLAAPMGFHYLSKVLDDVFQVCLLEPDAFEGRGGWVSFDEAFETKSSGSGFEEAPE
jgi:putative acetyltransferase